MKLVVFGLSLICTFAWAMKINDYHAYAEYNILKRNMFEEFIENFKTIMQTGNDTLGIPILDPFTAKQLPIAIDNEMIKFDALLKKVKVDGLSAYDVNKADYQIIGLKFILKLFWSSIKAKTNYTMKGKTDIFEIYGNGKIKISLQDFFFETEIAFTTSGKYLKVKNMKLKISLRALDFNATGLFDDDKLSELLSAVISDMVPQLIEDYHDEITDIIIFFVTEKLNDFLSTMTLSELLKLIGLGS